MSRNVCVCCMVYVHVQKLRQTTLNDYRAAQKGHSIQVPKTQYVSFVMPDDKIVNSARR